MNLEPISVVADLGRNRRGISTPDPEIGGKLDKGIRSFYLLA